MSPKNGVLLLLADFKNLLLI
uniref:Uncharacterized protein n=1 Tax=Anguilla anguilla TaxID=7936 RepID=A0A0E9V5T8_ANGAN